MSVNYLQASHETHTTILLLPYIHFSSSCPFTFRYDLNLIVDVVGAGSNFLSLPILAECVVPEVRINPGLIDYGRCFINHPYAQVCSYLLQTYFV